MQLCRIRLYMVEGAGRAGALASRLGGHKAHQAGGLTSFRNESRRSLPFQFIISDRSTQQLLMRAPRSRADRSHLGRTRLQMKHTAKVSPVL
jgi:hypothetical protein